jgi:UDP-N-acetylglucosamine--N-acetylmuramyl-(pentapeptide) pyrophosphoryl-undecaprenol N-acetylglucosamine transferase
VAVGEVLLVLGGSLGARALNRCMLGAAPRLLSARPELHVVWQTGSGNHAEVLRWIDEAPAAAKDSNSSGDPSSSSSSTGPSTVTAKKTKVASLHNYIASGRLEVVPFLEDMAGEYRRATLAVSRAGAITCSELLATRTPSLLIPSPNVAEDHQAKNAEEMAQGLGE